MNDDPELSNVLEFIAFFGGWLHKGKDLHGESKRSRKKE